MDTFKLNKWGILKFDALCEQYNFNTLWLPNIDNIVNFIAYLFPESYSFPSAKTYISGKSFCTIQVIIADNTCTCFTLCHI